MPEAVGHARDGSTFPIHSCARQLPAHDAGTRVTVRMMTDKATGDDGAEGAEHPQVRDFALQATANCPDRDDWAQAKAIYQAVKDTIRFRGERGETVQSPVLTLKWQAGDCDDFATLTCALLLSIGIPSRIQTVSLPGHKDFRHVYAVVGIRHRGQVVQWRALDETVPNTQAGWQPPDITRRRFWGGDRLGRTSDMQGYYNPGMSGFWSKMAKGSLHAGKIALKSGEGFITGGPTGALSAGSQAALGRRAAFLQQVGGEIPGLSGYTRGFSIPERRYAPTPLPPPIPTDPTWHGGNRIYLGDAGYLGDPGFFDQLTTTQKVVGGVAAVALLVALTQ
jgi:hypothetical protein